MQTDQTSMRRLIHFGMQSDVEVMEQLIEPFQRGENCQQVKGFVIGLAVALIVAEQHSGDIQFARRSEGLRVTLSLQSNHLQRPYGSMGWHAAQKTTIQEDSGVCFSLLVLVAGASNRRNRTWI